MSKVDNKGTGTYQFSRGNFQSITLILAINNFHKKTYFKYSARIKYSEFCQKGILPAAVIPLRQ